MPEKVLEVKDLKTYFYTDEGELRAVDGLSYHVNKGESVGLVGESACGKSVSAMSIMRLIPTPPGEIVDGSVTFLERDLLQILESEMRHVRGGDIAHSTSQSSTPDLEVAANSLRKGF